MSSKLDKTLQRNSNFKNVSFVLSKIKKVGKFWFFVHFFNIFEKPEIWEIIVNKFPLQFSYAHAFSRI